MAWEIDAAHSQITFAVKHMMISTVRGNFKVFGGKLHIDPDNAQNSYVDATADAASVDTRDANRDAHLRSPDFFDAEQFPVIAFKSKKIEGVGGSDYMVTGDLTMHGVTKEVTFKAVYGGQLKDPWGATRAGLNVSGSINRKDWGLNWNSVLEAGGVMVSEEVKIEMELEATNKE